MPSIANWMVSSWPAGISTPRMPMMRTCGRRCVTLGLAIRGLAGRAAVEVVDEFDDHVRSQCRSRTPVSRRIRPYHAAASDRGVALRRGSGSGDVRSITCESAAFLGIDFDPVVRRGFVFVCLPRGDFAVAGPPRCRRVLSRAGTGGPTWPAASHAGACRHRGSPRPVCGSVVTTVSRIADSSTASSRASGGADTVSRSPVRASQRPRGCPRQRGRGEGGTCSAW